MNKESFLHLISHPQTISAQDTELLQDVVDNFPYCQLAHVLIAKATHDLSTMLAPQKLRKAAAYAINRDALKKLVVENLLVESSLTQAAPNDPTPLSTEKSLIPIFDQQHIETLTFDDPVIQTDQLLDEIQNIAPVVLSTEDEMRMAEKRRQFEIIENFIKAEPRISSLRVEEKNASPEKDLAEGRIAGGGKIISENLAKILVKQGKIERAIDMYQELICKNPQKKAYFASKIDELNSNA